MICRLWEFQNDTNCVIDSLGDITSCYNECEHYDCDGKKCGCCEDLNEVLTSSNHG